MWVTRYQTPMDSGGETFGRGPSRKVFAMQSGSGILHGTRAPPSGLATQPFWVDAKWKDAAQIVRCDILDMCKFCIYTYIDMSNMYIHIYH